LKEITEHLQLSQKDNKIIYSNVNSVFLEGVLDSDTIRIRSFIDDGYWYETIYVIQVQLKEDLNFAFVNERLHLAFPNPLILVYTLDNKTRISLATKRMSKVAKDKSVIDGLFFTNWFILDDEHIRFIKLLNVQKTYSLNLKDFYENMTNIIYSERLIQLIGKMPIKIPRTMDLRKAIIDIDNHISVLDELKRNSKQASMMSEKMDYHMKIKNKEKEIETLINKLKEDLING
jgi:hypothetical protein